MKGKWFIEGQIIGILRDKEMGAKIEDLVLKHLASEATDMIGGRSSA